MKSLLRKVRAKWHSDLYAKLGSVSNRSYAQYGEDLVVEAVMQFCFNLKNQNLNYLDIGSNHPTERNNTYLFYQNSGGGGVLVDPNPIFVELTRQLRPRDLFINAGISFNGERSAKYYDFGDICNGLNTFSEESCRKTQKRIPLVRTIELPLIEIGDIISTHFKAGLDFLSIDAESLDFEIMKRIDFQHSKRAKIICVEANKTNLKYGCQNDIVEYMESNSYCLVADTFINFVFADLTQMNPENRELMFNDRTIFGTFGNC